MSANPELLSERFPGEAAASYEACEDGAKRHAGPGKLFDRLSTDLDRYPMQSVDCNILSATPMPIRMLTDQARPISPRLPDEADEFYAANHQTIGNIYNSLTSGKNILLAVPTHSQIHDIALILVQVGLALADQFEMDDATKRWLIFSVGLKWTEYDLQGIPTPVPEIARMLGNVAFTMPHSKSGDKFNNELQDEFNKRTLQGIGAALDEGGQIIVMATGGSTNIRIPPIGPTFLECQGVITEGTTRFMTTPGLETVPVACHIDANNHLTTWLGELKQLKTATDCVRVGTEAADRYHDLSRIHAFHPRTRAQYDALARMKLEDLQRAAVNSRPIRFLLDHFGHDSKTESETE